MMENGNLSKLLNMLPPPNSVPTVSLKNALAECDATKSVLASRMDPLPHASALAISVLFQLSCHDDAQPHITKAVPMDDINTVLASTEETEYTKKWTAYFVEQMARHDAARAEFLESRTIKVLLELHPILDSDGQLYTRDALRTLGKYEDTKQWLQKKDPSLWNDYTSFIKR